jgi:hypothetical protein
LAVAFLLVGLLLAVGAPRLVRWRAFQLHGPWLHPRQLTRIGYILLTIHWELLAASFVTIGVAFLAPGEVGVVLVFAGVACYVLNLAMQVLVTLPLMLVGVATERRPETT